MMSAWNHRVVDLTDDNGGEPLLGFREVYYDNHGEPTAYGEPFMVSEDVSGLRELVAHLQKALTKPIVKFNKQESEVKNGI